jgi:hypothetical protein
MYLGGVPEGGGPATPVAVALNGTSIPPAIFKMGNDPAFTAAAREKKLESRYLDDINLVLGLSEKVASIIFPDLEGKFDYVSFRTKDAEALNWAKSMFMYYWNNAKR